MVLLFKIFKMLYTRKKILDTELPDNLEILFLYYKEKTFFIGIGIVKNYISNLSFE